MKPVNFSFDFSQPGSANQSENIISSGYASLDALLPHGGWPVGAITEIFCPENSQDVLPLIWPALARLNQAKRWLAMIAPPDAPSASQLQTEGINLTHVLMIHPHATSNGLWAVEHALRSGTCAAVLSWVNHTDKHAMQDLRGAALAGNCCGLIFRPERAIDQVSSASLRLHVTPMADQSIYIELLSQRKSQAHSAIFIEPQRLGQTA